MAGANLLSDLDFSIIDQFDFQKCNSPAFGYGGRKTTQFLPGKIAAPDAASQALQALVNKLDDVEILIDLVSRSLNGVDANIWAKDLDLVRSLYISPLILVCADSQAYDIKMHHDNSPAMQIYLGPDNADVGTRFHAWDKSDQYTQLPFRANTGYFQVNSKYGLHSAQGKPGVLRRTIMIFWILAPNPNGSFY